MSTDMRSPGFFGCLRLVLLLVGELCRHLRLVALPNRHAAHAGIGVFAKYLGKTPCFAIV